MNGIFRWTYYKACMKYLDERISMHGCNNVPLGARVPPSHPPVTAAKCSPWFPGTTFTASHQQNVSIGDRVPPSHPSTSKMFPLVPGCHLHSISPAKCSPWCPGATFTPFHQQNVPLGARAPPSQPSTSKMFPLMPGCHLHSLKGKVFYGQEPPSGDLLAQKVGSIINYFQ